MLLQPNFPQHQEIPREYHLTTNEDFNARGSQFVFSEEDLQGFKDKSKNTGLPLSVLRARSERVDKPKQDRNKRYQRPARKAVPSMLPTPFPLCLRFYDKFGVFLTAIVSREDKDRREIDPRDDRRARSSGAT